MMQTYTEIGVDSIKLFLQVDSNELSKSFHSSRF